MGYENHFHIFITFFGNKISCCETQNWLKILKSNFLVYLPYSQRPKIKTMTGKMTTIVSMRLVSKAKTIILNQTPKFICFAKNSLSKKVRICKFEFDNMLNVPENKYEPFFLRHVNFFVSETISQTW